MSSPRSNTRFDAAGLERPESDEAIELTNAGSYIVVLRGVWHTAKKASACPEDMVLTAFDAR